MLSRTCAKLVSETIETFGKMAFVSGPRQVGKTTLAEEYKKRYTQSLYINWDNASHRKRLLKDPYFFERIDRDPKLPFLLIFDEIHKYARWKNYLKGAYDTYRNEFRFLITGSGRLDLFKKGGESLLEADTSTSHFFHFRWVSWLEIGKAGLNFNSQPRSLRATRKKIAILTKTCWHTAVFQSLS